MTTPADSEHDAKAESETNCQNSRPDVFWNAGRIAGIDGLRALAVVFVILFHLEHAYLPGGFTGVDIFFVISGYVVCGSLLRERGEPFRALLGRFYLRRIFRIYPALVCMLLAAGLLSMWFIPKSYLGRLNGQTGEWAFFGAGNLVLAFFQNSYFSDTTDYNPFAHTWSLGVEEQYYLLFPLLLFAVFATEKRGGILQKSARLLLPVLCAASWLYSMRETAANHDSAYYNLPSRFWELGVGALLCLLHERGRGLPSSPRAGAWLVYGGAGLLLAGGVATDARHFPFPLAALPVLGTVLCISGLAVPRPAGLAAAFLTRPTVVWIGRISYSLYLWHWVVIALLRWTVGAEGLSIHCAALILTLALGTVSYYGLEVPFQRATRFFQRHGATSFVAGVCVVAAGLFTFRHVMLETTQQRHGLSVVSRYAWYWYPYVDEGERPDSAGKRWSGRRLFVIGDSHAGAYAGMLNEVRKHDGVAIYVNSVPGGGVGSLVYPQNGAVEKHTAEILEMLAGKGRPGDVVLLANLRMKRLCNQTGPIESSHWSWTDDVETEAKRLLAVEQGVDFIQKIEAMGMNVIIPAPLPVFKAPPFRGADWFNHMNPSVAAGFSVDKEFILERRARAMKSLHEVERRLSGVRLWDPLPALCPGPVCRAFDGDKPLFFDGDHLSAYGGAKLSPSFSKVLETVWPDNSPGK